MIVNTAHTTYAYTGGKAIDPAKPTVVFIHGVLNDHSVWILQSRYFAHHGFNVLALDLPGHCKSAGAPPASVQAAGAWVWEVLDTLNIERASLVGHSLGSLIALEAASQAPQRCKALVMVGSAYPMKVSAALLDASLNAPEQAIAMVNTFSHSSLCPPPSALGPGTWLYGASRALMRRVLASNTGVNLFHHGFGLCNTYAGGAEAMAKLKAAPDPVSTQVGFILGRSDQMTPPKACQSLIDAAPANRRVEWVDAGHSLMTEAPEAVLAAMKRML